MPNAGKFISKCWCLSAKSIKFLALFIMWNIFGIYEYIKNRFLKNVFMYDLYLFFLPKLPEALSGVVGWVEYRN